MCEKYSEHKKSKKTPASIGEKNATIERIFKLVLSNNNFLLLGHTYADEDCIASLVAVALLLKKFQKKAIIYFEKPIFPHLAFFYDMCEYNSIPVITGNFKRKKKPDVIFVLDTPKPSMIAASGTAIDFLNDPSIPKIEFDHHFEGNADYTGDPGYRLTMRASSTGEIIAHLCAKLENRPLLLKDYGITELYSRNIVLAILTGMIGDAKLGNYLFKKRDKIFYDYFLKKFNNFLNEKCYVNSKNISSANQIVNLFETLSYNDNMILKKIMPNADYKEKIAIIFIDEKQSQDIITEENHTSFVDVIKKATNMIAETVSGIGISAYYEPCEISDKIQFRVRASQAIKGIDLRPILNNLNITDGGGHPGAIGFRFSRNDIKNIDEFTQKLIDQVQEIIKNEPTKK